MSYFKGSHQALEITKKGALDLQPQVIKITSCFPWSVAHSDTPASSTTKTGGHDIAEILLKVALSTKKIKSNHISSTYVECRLIWFISMDVLSVVVIRGQDILTRFETYKVRTMH